MTKTKFVLGVLAFCVGLTFVGVVFLADVLTGDMKKWNEEEQNA